MLDVAKDLAAAFIGFLIAQAFNWTRAKAKQRAQRWFWQFGSYKKITIVIGHHDPGSLTGEIEASMNIVDALTLGELRTFLVQHFSEVVVCDGENDVDWTSPVVSLGGPLANSLTARLGDAGRLPIWFHGLPYNSASTRIISGQGASFESTFDSTGTLVKDVGFVAKISSDKTPGVPLFVVASNYGAGNHGVARLISSVDGLKQLRAAPGTERFFQGVVQSNVNKNLSVGQRILTAFPAN